MKYMGIRIAAILFLFALRGSGQAQFPVITGTTLAGEAIMIPQDNGKKSVVAIAFDKSAEDALKKWLQPLYDDFIKKEENVQFDLADFYDVNFAFVPLIRGFKKVADEFKSNTDEHYWPYVIDTGKSEIKELQRHLVVDDNKEPYFYVLDEEGKILTTVKGRYTDKKLEQLEEALEDE